MVRFLLIMVVDIPIFYSRTAKSRALRHLFDCPINKWGNCAFPTRRVPVNGARNQGTVTISLRPGAKPECPLFTPLLQTVEKGHKTVSDEIYHNFSKCLRRYLLFSSIGSETI